MQRMRMFVRKHTVPDATKNTTRSFSGLKIIQKEDFRHGCVNSIAAEGYKRRRKEHF